MGTLHFCMLCHTEGTRNDFDRALPVALELRNTVQERTGKPFPLSWGLGTYHGYRNRNGLPVFEEYNTTFRDLMAKGDEMGLHPHATVRDGRLTVEPFIKGDTAAMHAAGFPRPKTFVAGTFTFYPSTLRILEEEGYEVDSSVVAGPTPQTQRDREDNLIHDFPPVDEWGPGSRRPYHLSRDNVAVKGDSPVIEVPCSGHLATFIGDRDNPIPERVAYRRSQLAENDVDVFEIFWHLSEFLEQGVWSRVDERTVENVRAFLTEIGQLPDVVFSTVYDAAIAWKTHEANKPAGGDA